MRSFQFVTVDVFTERQFGGNPLAVFTDAEGLSDAEMQSLATELNLSETTFVLPPASASNAARVRIFNRSAEMEFAGHPTVGTAWVLHKFGRAKGPKFYLEEAAGLVEVRINKEIVTIDAPKPLALGAEMPPELFAACVGLSPQDVLVSTHQPVCASVGHPFVLGEVSSDALERAVPDVGQFRQASRQYKAAEPHALSLYLYVRHGDQLRARMFSPLAGTIEDPATGSAATPLAALLLSLTGEAERHFVVLQGQAMGRPSQLFVTALRTESGFRASVGGSCVPVLKGEVCLPEPGEQAENDR
jgi:trans-2,3-dihydro-3-hydroxyanthranilate isomerase